jgi:hypothetical protein
MLIEELPALPVGTQVWGDLDITGTIPGVVQSRKDGSHFIRWADGYVTFPFGWIRDYDEYVAARTEIQPSRCARIRLGSDAENETDGARV